MFTIRPEFASSDLEVWLRPPWTRDPCDAAPLSGGRFASPLALALVCCYLYDVRTVPYLPGLSPGLPPESR